MKLALILLTAGMVAAPATWAQRLDTEPIPDLPLKNVPPASSPAPTVGGWHVSLGGGMSYGPRYEGSASDRLRFMPMLDVSYNNGKLFLSPLRGIGYNFSDNKALEYGLRISMGHVRKQNVDARLNGMGDIGYSAEAGAFLNIRFAPWYISSSLSAGIHGTHAELGGGIGIPLSLADRLRLGVNLNWGNTQYNQTYFGVRPDQATASNGVLTAYNASAGVKDYALTANWSHNYGKEWFSSTGISSKRLIGSAQYSPLTMRRTMNSINFLVGYRF